MSGGAVPGFVKWREHFVSQERGRRLVHYFLEDASGGSHLAVVGTEKSVRHMLYVVPEEFHHIRRPAAAAAAVPVLKWRSRREVVDWLNSFLPRHIRSRDRCSKSPKDGSGHILGDEIVRNGVDDPGSYQHRHPDHLGRSLRTHNSDIIWSGVSWTCNKQLRHFQTFHRNGTTIATHSFVLVLSEEENRYIAYLEDMYEDKKGQKKVKVRWFHKNQEFTCPIPPPKPHPREIFITSYSQVISAECVDDIATVLTPQHYDKCVAALPYAASAGIHLCSRQYNKNRFKPFDLTSVSGYFDQSVLSYLDNCTMSREEGLGNGGTAKQIRYKRIQLAKGNQNFATDGSRIILSGQASHLTACKLPYHNRGYCLPAKKPVSLKFVGPRKWLIPPYKVDEKIELLCQDSGIRGCWFRCTVLQLSEKRLKVHYDDVCDEDGCGNLEEWTPAFKLASPDKLGMRCSGRLTIRPCLTHYYLPDDVPFRIGSPIDTWWNDGWWEGVVIGVDGSGDDNLQVYLPGENVFLTCQRKDTRISRDWVNNQWVAVDVKPNILSVISMIISGEKLSTCSTFAKGVESGNSAMSGREIVLSDDRALEEDRKAVPSLNSGTDGSLEDVEHANPRKRCRDEDVDDVCDYEDGYRGG